MKIVRPPSLSKVSKIAITVLGQMIRTARLERKLSQQDLAQRLNVSRYTIMSIEQGKPNVAIGAAFEAAYILGIPLLAEDIDELKRMNAHLSRFAAILPKKIRNKRGDLDDNF